ncbi:RNA polymerase sigma factor [Marinifilum caeruleilacunae]|jgi:RNA polymerase sigma-70 factor (ECF subfamily)|uniref:Sigma-70 family RNA polymerase sigma factor n=1 Tax=Marinifilum caeruleilacunae TaxID=2499076 RepID=A0ABX1WYG6_9BACT|nr:sigma-70 family RNA polymerase sigma factor [Marinifilum caeruleilacunae]NOU61026.1 sigma-70 family RNA polymerase sigma factor [Marinifilum caeruleilacunae]
MLNWNKKSEELTDQELLESYIDSSNLDVLGVLYSRYMHLVYGVCLKYLHDREKAKDAVNVIFEHLITEIPKFDIKNFKPWLYVVCKNYCLMELRKQKSQRNQADKFLQTQIMELDTYLHPIDEVRDENLEKNLKRCIERLKEEQQKCILLFYYEESCYKEISDELNLPINKVKSYIQNGKRNLKICMEEFAKQNEV